MGKNTLSGTIPEDCPVLDGLSLNWELEGTLWKIGELHKEKSSRIRGASGSSGGCGRRDSWPYN